MYVQDIIGELLYVGIVAEKGRCYGIIWKHGYKKILQKHMQALNMLQIALQSDAIAEIQETLNLFVTICYQILHLENFTTIRLKNLKN